VAAVGAWYLRRGRFVNEAELMLSMALWLLSVLVTVQAARAAAPIARKRTE
jgi:hypothetical protein